MIQASLDRYLHGDCMVLANALSLRLGVSLIGIYDDMWDTVPRHVAVEVAEGRYADARGCLGKEEFLQGYSGPGSRIVPLRPDRLREIWDHRVHDWNVPDTVLDLLCQSFEQKEIAP